MHGFMLLEIAIANLLFLSCVTVITGWQSDILMSFARLKQRSENLRRIADFNLAKRLENDASPLPFKACQQELIMAERGKQQLASLLGAIEGYHWHYTTWSFDRKK